MNNWFLSSFNSHCLDNLLKCPFDLTRQNNGVQASITLLLKSSIKNTISILLSSHFSVLCPLGFTILRHPLPRHRLSCFSLQSFPSFLFFHLCCLAITHSHFMHLFVSLFCIYRMPMTVKTVECGSLFTVCAAHTVCIPILLHRCLLLGERASRVRPSHSCFHGQTSQSFSLYKRLFLWG